MFLGKFQCPKSGGKFQAVRRKWAKLAWVKKRIKEGGEDSKRKRSTKRSVPSDSDKAKMCLNFQKDFS